MFQVQVNVTNLGYPHNFINAVKRATADILFLCDQDDIWNHKRSRVSCVCSTSTAQTWCFRMDHSLTSRGGNSHG